MPLRPTCFTASGTTTTYTTTTTRHIPKITSIDQKLNDDDEDGGDSSPTALSSASYNPNAPPRSSRARPGRARVPRLARIGSWIVPAEIRTVWTMLCNGWKLGFAVWKKAMEPIRLMLKSMQSTRVGAGIIPSSGLDSDPDNGGELMYMTANYECVVDGPNSESFHLINLDGCPGQEFKHLLDEVSVMIS